MSSEMCKIYCSFAILRCHLASNGGGDLQRYVLMIFIHIFCNLAVLCVVLPLLRQSYIGTHYIAQLPMFVAYPSLSPATKTVNDRQH